MASQVSTSSPERVNKLQSCTGTFKDPSSICKGCLEVPNLDLSRLCCRSLGVGVGRARINHSRDTTYRSIPANQKAPCCGEFPWNARGPLPLTFGGGRCCFITATGKDGVGWCQRVRSSFPIMPTPPGPPEAELFQDLCVSQLPVDAEGRQGWK